MIWLTVKMSFGPIVFTWFGCTRSGVLTIVGGLVSLSLAESHRLVVTR